jgi:hypothetical protein
MHCCTFEMGCCSVSVGCWSFPVSPGNPFFHHQSDDVVIVVFLHAIAGLIFAAGCLFRTLRLFHRWAFASYDFRSNARECLEKAPRRQPFTASI